MVDCNLDAPKSRFGHLKGRKHTMTSRAAFLLGVLALILCVGCAGPSGFVGNDPGFGDSSGIPDCRNRGVYNRAADRCVSEGP